MPQDLLKGKKIAESRCQEINQYAEIIQRQFNNLQSLMTDFIKAKMALNNLIKLSMFESGDGDIIKFLIDNPTFSPFARTFIDGEHGIVTNFNLMSNIEINNDGVIGDIRIKSQQSKGEKDANSEHSE